MKAASFTAQGLLLVTLSLITSGCLKTRAQLREEHEEGGPRPATSVSPNAPSSPQPAQVQEVQGGYAIDEIKGELTRLNGRIEDLERAQQSNTGDANKEEIKKLEARIIQLEQAQAQMIEALKKLQEAQAAQAQQAQIAADPAEAFNKAKAHYSVGEYDQAIEGFTAVVKSAKGARLEDAIFYRAESYYALKHYNKAIVDYSKFPEKYTHSHYLPTALYKIGLSFDALGMRDDAQNFYQELVEKFPRSPEAQKVKKGHKKANKPS